MNTFSMTTGQRHRGVLKLSGADARGWLENLVTNDFGAGDTMFAALLSPQGKILFDFFAIDRKDHILIETRADAVDALAKRLTMYKLRAAVTVEPMPQFKVYAAPADMPLHAQSIVAKFEDPRAHALGVRVIADAVLTETADATGYTAHRVALCVPEASLDYDLGQTFPHEANFDLLNGVSFTKGCFIGQEVVARMQNKSVTRKRIVRVHSDAPLARGTEITAGPAPIGTIGTALPNGDALALVRLDRIIDAETASVPLRAGPASITVDPVPLEAYRKAIADRPPAPDL